MGKSVKTVLLFGYLPREIARNWIIDNGLTTHGLRVEECRTQKRGAIAKFIDLARQYRRKQHGIDVILVTFMGFYYVPLAWVLARMTRKMLVFDALVSLYEAEVEDRRRLSRFDPRAWFLFMLEWFCYRVSDLVLLESPVYGASLTKRFGTAAEKLLALPVGCRSDVFHPAEKKTQQKKLRVMYQGRFIPVHGVETILEAAAVIQKKGIHDIEFHLVGKGQTENAMKDKARRLGLTNVVFRGFLPTLDAVAQELRHADIGLGMFQKSRKNDLCMPHKVYEVLASAVALITSDTTSRRAMFGDAEIGLFIPPEDPEALARAILTLMDDDTLRLRIAENGHAFFRSHYEPEEIVSPLMEFLQKPR